MAVIVDDAAFDVVKLDAHAIGPTDVAPEASDELRMFDSVEVVALSTPGDKHAFPSPPASPSTVQLGSWSS